MFGFLAPLLGGLFGGGAAAAVGGATLGGALTAAIPDLIGAGLSLASASKQRRQAQGDAAAKFVDLRAAAEAGGFNPLTALQATGGAGYGGYPSSAPPLASVELLTGALGKAQDEISGQAAQRRAADRLNLDLAQLRLDQARSGVVVGPGPSATSGAVLGARPSTRYSVNQKLSGGTNAHSPADLAALRAAGASQHEQRLDIIDLYVPYRMRNGGIVFGPNPDIADLEQLGSGVAMDAMGKAKGRSGVVFGATGSVTVSPGAAGAFKAYSPLGAGYARNRFKNLKGK